MEPQSIEGGDASMVEQAIEALDIQSTTVHHELLRGIKNGEITDVRQGTGDAWGIFFDGDVAAKSNIVRYLPEAGLRIQTVHFENAGFFVEVDG